MRHWVQAQLRSNWIELLALPIITSIMEAQPTFVLLVFTSPVYASGATGSPFLNEMSVVLLVLGLRWWAMGVHAYVRHNDVSENNQRLLYVLGLLIAGGLVIGTPVLLVRSILSLIFSSALVLWCWWRGIRQVTSLDDEQLVMSFRVGFAVLLIILIFSVLYLSTNTLYSDADYNTLFTALAQALPIFFLSGLLGLSFNRIALLRHEVARYAPDNAMAGSTRNWLIVLTAFWLAVVSAVLALEAFSFQSVILVAGILWAGISTILLWLITLIAYIITPILYGISLVFTFLISLLHIRPPNLTSSRPAAPPPTAPLGQPQHFPPAALAAGRVILLSLALIALFFVVRVLLRRLRTRHKEDEVEEIREGLSLRSIVQSRREERQKAVVSQPPTLEALDPDSARAHYRDLLQAVAASRPGLTRQPDETPLEYQTRLLGVVKQTMAETQAEETMPTEQELLDALTHDYTLERYAGQQLAASRKGYLRTWVPRLVARLTQK